MQGAASPGPGVYEVHLDPTELTIFDKPLHRSGAVSILQVTSDAPLIDGTRLSFDHKSVLVLNQGTTRRAIVVTESALPTEAAAISIGVETTGDRRFLNELPPDLRDLGEQLLAGVRAQSPGELKFFPKSKIYVEQPDNFWAVKIQTRVRDLAVSVRGEPDWHGRVPGLDIKKAQASYSGFKIVEPSQVPAAVRVILGAPRK